MKKSLKKSLVGLSLVGLLLATPFAVKADSDSDSDRGFANNNYNRGFGYVNDYGANNFYPASMADTVMLRADLRGSSEVPANNSAATGTGTFTLNKSTNVFTYNVAYSGLAGTFSAAHVHGPATTGQNAPIVFGLSGTNPLSGSVTLTDAQETDLLAGKMYVNVHSSLFPDGEIRGQISVTSYGGGMPGNAGHGYMWWMHNRMHYGNWGDNWDNWKDWREHWNNMDEDDDNEDDD